MKQRIFYLLPLSVFLILAIYFAVGLTKDPRRLPSALIDRAVPAFDLEPIQGHDRGFKSTDLLGQVSLVNVFGSWCVACLAEHPFLIELKETKAIPIYGLNWRETSPDAAIKWLKRHGDPYTLIGNDADSRVAIDFGVTGAPESFIVDKQGTVRYKHVGPIYPDIWEKTLLPIVEALRKE
ncbi:MAG: DsbE family thiol:disulfide interchange protein [Rhodospirillales bacterium]|nr:DsbE family thiol:disulfide interchange protein [Rhodospirillales bacterium]